MSSKAFLAVVSGLAALAVGVQSAAAEGVWIHGKVHGLVTGPPTSQTTTPTPLYVIAPVRRHHPLHPFADAIAEGWGAHDHVAARVFSGPCDLTMVVPGARGKGKVRTRRTETPNGPKPLVYAALIGGRMRPLTSTTRILRAEKARLVTAVDMHVVISCTVKP